MIARLVITGLMLAPGLVPSSDLRVATVRYEGGAAQYRVSENQYVVCEKCPPAKRLEEMPAASPAPINNAPEFLGVIGQIPIPASSTRQSMVEESKGPEMATQADRPLATVYFTINDARLRPSEERRIREAVAGGIGSGVAVRVEGYTCRKGAAAYNRKLSARRANAVSLYLKRLGVPVSEVLGLGKSRPLGGALSKDRRAEIVIKETQAGESHP